MATTTLPCSIPSCTQSVDLTGTGPITTSGWYPTGDGGCVHARVDTALGGVAGARLCPVHAQLSALVDWWRTEGYELHHREGVDAGEYVDAVAAGALSADAVIACGGRVDSLRALCAR